MRRVGILRSLKTQESLFDFGGEKNSFFCQSPCLLPPPQNSYKLLVVLPTWEYKGMLFKRKYVYIGRIEENDYHRKEVI